MSPLEPMIGNAKPAGYPEQVAALFREHHRALLAFLQCRLGSFADAQELAQEAYLRMLGLEHPDEVDSKRAFLFRIAANLAVDRLRMRKLREPVAGEEPLELEPTPELHRAPLPERHVAAGEQWHALREALRELPAKTSRAFVLHAIDGRDFEAIAKTMKLSTRMVRYHVARAIEHCRAQVEDREIP
jgi:RNA polymerase sigma-70 factor (ECF subfamily)